MDLKCLLAIAASLAIAAPLTAGAVGPSDAPITPRSQTMASSALSGTGLAEGLKNGPIQRGQIIAVIPVAHSLTGVLKTDVVRSGIAGNDLIPAGQYVFGVPMRTSDQLDVTTWCAPRQGPAGQFATVCFPSLAGVNYWVSTGDSLVATDLHFDAATPLATGVNIVPSPVSLGGPMKLSYEFDGWIVNTLNGQRHLAASVSVKLSANGHQTLVGHIIEYGDASGGFHLPIQNGLVTLILLSKTGERVSPLVGSRTAEQFDNFYSGLDPDRAELVAFGVTATGYQPMIRSRPIWVTPTGDFRIGLPVQGDTLVGTLWPVRSEPAHYFPDRALRMGVSGKATIRCTVAAVPPEGVAWRLDDCTLVDETPASYGFGAATLHYAKTVRMDSTSIQGMKLGDVITRTIVWQAPSDTSFKAPAPTH